MVTILHAANLLMGDHQFYREYKRVFMSLPQCEGGHRYVKPISNAAKHPNTGRKKKIKK
jgi:hypothetical protein